MAFSSFGNPAATMGGGGSNVQMGPDLEDIQTAGLGFLAISGDSKVQLLPTAWPSDKLPPSTSSLLSIASQKGLIAASGPDAVIVATTESVRRAFEVAAGTGNLKRFEPQLTIPMPMRLSQVVFSADESCLVLSAETGGGLAVYDVQALLKGSKQSAFELSTNGASLRALIPNPTPEKSEFLALITNDGNLMMANLKERRFVTGPNGNSLKGGVSCVSWSTRGKQLVAGLGDGTAYQMTPEGEGKAEIPRPPSVNPNDHVSSITWLENNVFLMVHTPSRFDDIPPSTFHIATRAPPSSFVFQKISDPTEPYGLKRCPPHHFVLRLKDFPPALQDVLIVASSASTDIGLLTRSKEPLTKDKLADKISGVFTMTGMAEDSSRAQLPLSQNSQDTSPIGFALDLSSKDKVFKPITGDDEITESAAPTPGLMVLTNEGVLASWWVIYSDSIRQKTVYPGLIAAGGVNQPMMQQSSASAATPSAYGAVAQPAFISPSSGAPAFGNPKPVAAFGASSPLVSTAGAFGAPSGLGKTQSPWATATSTTGSMSGPTFGSSAFSSTAAAQSSGATFGTPSFGSTSLGLGNRQSVWGSGGSTAPAAAFGQTGGLGKSTPTFGATQSTPSAPSGGGFSAFASKGGFAAAAAPAGSAGSVFGQTSTTSFELSNSQSTSVFGQPKTESPSVFGKPTTESVSVFGLSKPEPTSAFGQPKADNKLAAGSFGSSFVLGSTFKADPSAKDKTSEKSNESKASFFGGNFGNALAETTPPSIETHASNEADMDSKETAKPSTIPKIESTTPFSSPGHDTQPASSKLSSTSGLFGTPSTSTPSVKPASAGFNFGQTSDAKTTHAGFSFSKLDTPAASVPQTPINGQSPPFQTPASPPIRQEQTSGDTTPVDKRISEAPLPPESTSKTTYGAGESTGSSTATDPPMLSDTTPKPTTKSVQEPALPPNQAVNKPIPAYMIPPSDVPGGPEDDGEESGFGTDDGSGDDGLSGGAGEEGSEQDVAKDLSPVSEANQTPGFTPESSFGGLKARRTEGNIFTKPTDSSLDKKKGSLFGEFRAPNLPPPKVQVSPRSPSPVRSAIPGRVQRPEAARSVSAPGIASQLLGSRGLGAKPLGPSKSTYVISQEERDAEEKHREAVKAEQEAEETRALINDDDERMQHELASDIVPSRTLDEFVAHTDYVGLASLESIPAQVEAVYRDINSMVDTMGLNARSLKAFIQGHEDAPDEPRTKGDLEDEEDWCLVEVENLSVVVEKELGRDLENGRIKDIAEKLEACNELQKDLIRLRAKHEDVKKVISLQRDPVHAANSRAQPLGAEQSAQQNDIRRDFTKFMKLLSEAEDRISVLKAKIVSQATSTGKNHSAGPTVEAVMRTISKLTNMAEKKSGDIDVLEGQMRRIRFSSPGSREGSPFADPQNKRSSLRHSTSSNRGLFFTPDSFKDTNQQRLLQNSVLSSNGSFGRSSFAPRKKMSGYTAEEKAHLRMKLAKKQAVTDKLREALGKAGTNVRLMGDDD